MLRHVLIPGSFDPPTLGHIDIITRAAALAETVEVVVFINPEKSTRFTQAERTDLLRLATADLPNVQVGHSDGYVADYARATGADAIVKGIRNGTDADYELSMAHYNRDRSGGVETLFLATSPALCNVSSTRVRELLEAGGDPSALLPPSICEAVVQAYKNRTAGAEHS